MRQVMNMVLGLLIIINIIAVAIIVIFTSDLNDTIVYLSFIPFFIIVHCIMKYRNGKMEKSLDSFYTVHRIEGVITNTCFIPLVVTRSSGNRGGARLYQATEVYNFITLLLNDRSEIDIIVSRNSGYPVDLENLQYDDNEYSVGQRVSIDVREHNEYFYCMDEIFYVINNYRDLKSKIK